MYDIKCVIFQYKWLLIAVAAFKMSTNSRKSKLMVNIDRYNLNKCREKKEKPFQP